MCTENLPACSEDPASCLAAPGVEDLLAEIVEVIGSGLSIDSIPTPPRPPRPQSASRRVQRRYARTLCVWEVANRTRTALLTLLRPGSPCEQQCLPPSRFCHAAVPPHVIEVWRRLVHESKRVVAGRRASLHRFPTGAALLSKIMRTDLSDLYTKPTEKQTYIPFVAGYIIEPNFNAPTVNLLGALPADLACHYQDINKLLRPATVLAEVEREFAGRYCRVIGHPREWVRYLARPDVAPLWTFVPASEAKYFFSVAAVPKKDGRWLRKLVQCVPLNAAIMTPAEMLDQPEVDYGLVGGVAISQVQGTDGHFAVHTLDESNAFSHVVIPESWRKYFAGPAIAARDVPAWARLPEWPDDLMIAPLYGRLGMGFSHAVFLLQTINLTRAIKVVEASALLASKLIRVHFLNREVDRQTRIQLTREETHEVGVYIHLDDVAVIAADDDVAEVVSDVIDKGLQDIGFLVTRSDAVKDGTPYVGFVPCRSPIRWQPAELRLGNMDRSIDTLLALPTVWVDSVHTILGTFMWMASIWRPAMSIPHAVYAFVRAHTGCFMPLWPSVRKELLLMQGILPLIYVDLGRKALPLVLAQDAATEEEKVYGHDRRHYGAYALAVAAPPYAELVAVLAALMTIGRANVMPGVSGSVRAPLGLAPQTPLLQRTILPRYWFGSSGPVWQIVLARRWQWSLEIIVGELMALVTWLKVLLRVVVFRVQRYEVLMLTDNAAVAGLVVRGRAARFDLNLSLRRLAAMSAIMDLAVRAPWIDTSHQPADGGTRLDEHGRLYSGIVIWKSKNIIANIYPATAALTTCFRSAGVECLNFIPFRRGMPTIKYKYYIKKLYRMLESGRIAVAIWNLNKFANIIIEDVILGINIAHRAEAAIVIWGPCKDTAWLSQSLWELLEDIGAVTCLTDACMFDNKYKITYRVAGTLLNLKTICRQCVAQRKCSRTGLKHQPLQQAIHALYRTVEQDSHERSTAVTDVAAAGLHSLAPHLVNLSIAELRRNTLARDSVGVRGAAIGRSQAGHEADVPRRSA